MTGFAKILIVGWIWLFGACAIPQAAASDFPEAKQLPRELRFPVDPQGHVLTSLRRSFPNSPDIAPGPSLGAVRHAAARLPFVLALASRPQLTANAANTAASRMRFVLHGAFEARLPVAILPPSSAAPCQARTGTACIEENVYGATFPATELLLANHCPLPGQAALAVVGTDRPDYHRLSLRPVANERLVRNLLRIVETTPQLTLLAPGKDSPPANGAGSRRLPLARVDRLPGPRRATFVLTFGGMDSGQPATLVLITDGRAHEVWLGCKATPRFFRIHGHFFLTWDYQDCDSGRRGTYVYLLEGAEPLPVCINSDSSG